MIWFELELSGYNGSQRDLALQGTRITKRGFLFFDSWADLAVFKVLWSIPDIRGHWARLVKAICGGGAFVNSWP